MVLLVRTTQNHLVKKLPNKLVTLLESMVPALRTGIVDSSLTRPAQSLIALQAVMRICHQVEAHWAGKGLFKELTLLLLIGRDFACSKAAAVGRGYCVEVRLSATGPLNMLVILLHAQLLLVHTIL